LCLIFIFCLRLVCYHKKSSKIFSCQTKKIKNHCLAAGSRLPFQTTSVFNFRHYICFTIELFSRLSYVPSKVNLALTFLFVHTDYVLSFFNFTIKKGFFNSLKKNNNLLSLNAKMKFPFLHWNYFSSHAMD
jgi:hypothetical protein